MCGVVAAVGERAEEQVRLGLGRLMHRGLRSMVESGRGWALGHVRLPIVGCTPRHDQPIRRGRWSVAFVGELIDFRERSGGYECDAELVADTWNQKGPRGFREFDGFWSVVAVDRRVERDRHLGGYPTVQCLVDYLSQKPLYVRDDEHARAVASEPDAVACLGPTRLDRTYLSAVCKWGYCPEAWRTPYLGIRRMLPGELADLGIPGWTDVSYRTVDTVKPVSKGWDHESVRVEVESAVRRRVQSSDVPVACLVSGGLDSSIVYLLAKRYGSVRPYHVENGEAEACRLVAPEAMHLTHDRVDLREALSWMQEPLDLGSLLPQAALSKAIAGTGAERVCLTGDGADELFGGYGRSKRYDSQASDVWHELVAWHLPRLDRIMMRSCIEVRSPFLSRGVVGLALGLPRELRTDKVILREAFRDLLPPSISGGVKRPLRTHTVELNRESHSVELVKMFEEAHRESQDAIVQQGR